MDFPCGLYSKMDRLIFNLTFQYKSVNSISLVKHNNKQN